MCFVFFCKSGEIKTSIKSTDNLWHFSFNTEWQLFLPALLFLHLTKSEYEHMWPDLVVHICLYGRRKVIWYVWTKQDCVYVCKYAWGKCVLYCMSECAFNVCQSVCVMCLCTRMYACTMEGVEELGLCARDQHHSYWGGLSPALVATHVNPATPKIGQWNTTYRRAHIGTHVHRYQVKESQPASRAIALSPVCDPRSTLPRTCSCRTDTSSGLEQED